MKPDLAAGPGLSDAEALPTATFACHIGIAEAKCLVQALLDEIHLRTIDELERLLIDDDLNAVIFEHDIGFVDVVSIIDDVGVARAACFLDTDAQPDALSPGIEIGSDTISSRLCKRDGH